MIDILTPGSLDEQSFPVPFRLSRFIRERAEIGDRRANNIEGNAKLHRSRMSIEVGKKEGASHRVLAYDESMEH